VRWSSWRRRTRQSTPILDQVLSYVTVTDPQHFLFGTKLAVLPERSGRGPAYLVVELPDGRRRSIAIASTDRGEAAALSSRRPGLPWISVRTLIPLTQHLNASLALLAEEVIRDDPTRASGSGCVSTTASSMPLPAVGKKSPAPMAEPAGRHAKAGGAGRRRVDPPNAGCRRRSRKGDGPC
jgi:hypothetical protein